MLSTKKNITAKGSVSLWTLRVVVLMLFACCIFPQCANIAAPQGGPRDTLPPVVMAMDPVYGTKNFNKKKIYIEFNEYVKLVDLQKEFFTSPFMKKKPTVTVRGRGIQIDIQDTLLENTTYALNFASSVRDNNEGNPLHGLRYVFSTGDEIDSMLMSGYTVDGYTGDSLSKAFILFYEASKDSIPEYDSTVFNAVPDVVARAQENGIFIAENLKPINYRVYAMQDNNNNQIYDPGVDKIGFLDTIYNPLHMPDFNIWYDTMRMYLVADPQLYFRMFTGDAFKRQYLKSHSRPEQNLLVMIYGSPYPDVRKVNFFDIDTSQVITEYLRPERDSVAYWLNLPGDILPDTIKGEVIFMKHDSINNLVPDTASLSFAWKFTETKQQEKDREKREKERQEAIERGEELEPEPNPFKVKVDSGRDLNPEKNITFTFDYPVLEPELSRITLSRMQGDNEVNTRFSFTQDTMKLREWVLSANWASGEKYKLLIPAGTFTNILGQSNDTLRSEFTVMDPEKYATLKLNVIGETDSTQYVLQLLGSNNNLINEIKHATSGVYYFNYINPGDVKVRIIRDDNKNGEWDKGNLIERRQSERVEVYTADNGEEIITTKMNWELSFDFDMKHIFAPLTMQRVAEKIRKTEDLRLRKLEKDRQARLANSPAGRMNAR